MKAVKAIWNNTVLAESDATVVVEGNHYFPPDSVKQEYFQDSSTQTTCPWKGISEYKNIVVEDKVNSDACWYYPNPSKEASRFKDYFAFWKDVEIVTETAEQRNEKIAHSFSGLLHQMDTDSLVHSLPVDFLHNLSFFNFENSTTACFYTDHEQNIRIVNPTFRWTFNHLEDPVGMSLENLLHKLGMLDEDKEGFQKTLLSHGWVKIPQLEISKGDDTFYFSLDVALTKHGELDSLSGIQGQFMDITREVALAKRIEEKSEELARFNQDIQDLLDNTGQGFLAFEQNCEIHEKYSKACHTFFGKPIYKLDFLELLFPGKQNADLRQSTKDVLHMVFTGLADMNTVEDLLPQEVQVQERILKMDYRWIPQSETTPSNKVMVILTDVTTEKELEAQLKEDEERNRTLLKIASDRDGFLEFLRELERLFQNLDSVFSQTPEQIDPHELFRLFHTIKGGAASYALTKVADEAHQIESQLEAVRSGHQKLTRDGVEQLSQDTQSLKQSVETSLEAFSQLIQRDEIAQDEKVYRVSSAKLVKLQEDLVKHIGTDYLKAVKECTEELKKQTIASVFRKYSSAADTLAENLGKSISIQCRGTSVEVDHERLSSFFGALIHLVRNSVDHGLETTEVRQMLGKVETGTLKIGAQQEANTLIITIEDDGAGIDPETIKSIALNKGLITPEWASSASEQSLIELIFAPGFSTKEAVSEVSGRGVGMDAVKATVDELKGSIVVQSVLDQGSTFTISIPKAC